MPAYGTRYTLPPPLTTMCPPYTRKGAGVAPNEIVALTVADVPAPTVTVDGTKVTVAKVANAFGAKLVLVAVGPVARAGWCDKVYETEAPLLLVIVSGTVLGEDP